MQLNYKAIGKRIKIARIEKGLTQEALAEKLNISKTYASNIERGTAQFSLPIIIGIANHLSVSADELLCDNLICAGKALRGELATIVKDCSSEEMRIIVGLVSGAIGAMRENKKLKDKL